MAVKRLTRREVKKARATFEAARTAGEKALLEWLFRFEQRDVPAATGEELDEMRRHLTRFAAVRAGGVLPAEVLPGATMRPAPRLGRRAVIDIHAQLRELLTCVRPLEPRRRPISDESADPGPHDGGPARRLRLRSN